MKEKATFRNEVEFLKNEKTSQDQSDNHCIVKKVVFGKLKNIIDKPPNVYRF